MSERRRRSPSERLKLLEDKITKARKEYEQLQQKRWVDIGKLASQQGLDRLELSQLSSVFERVAREVL